MLIVDILFCFVDMLTDPQGHVCAVTGKPAQYHDPLTGCWFADAQAFKVLRSKATGTKAKNTNVASS